MVDDDLARRLTLLEACVWSSVQRRRGGDPNPDDPFRGLYVAADTVDRLLAGPAAPVEQLVVEPPAPASVLAGLAARFVIDHLELAILVIAAAPDLDQRYERLYGYLHDDVTRRRASCGLALELCGRRPSDVAARTSVSPAGRLVGEGLVEIEEGDRPFLTRSLRVPDRVLNHLLGDDLPDIELFDIAVPTSPRCGPVSAMAGRALATGTMLVHLRERYEMGASGLAASALRLAGLGAPVCIDLRLAHPDRQFRLADLARREAKLIGGGLVVVGCHDLAPPLRRHLARGDVPTFLVGAEQCDPEMFHPAPLSLEVEPATADEQAAAWRQAIDEPTLTPPTTFRLDPAQIRRAVDAARAHANAEGRPLDAEHLVVGARRQNASGLETLARRIEPSCGWDRIVLDTATNALLQQLVGRVRHRTQVLDGWKLRRGGGRGEGVVALFAGASGTGKTLAAEVIAGALGLEMYVINLATVVDKYIGETEKNLERIFAQAEGVNAVLLFDEADALFGKRSEVSDARDRYANIEVAYLLQRIETFDGLGILTTNLKTSLDDAFARRLSMVVDFPDPDATLRLRLWQQMCSSIPLDPDADLAFCAERFELSGGNIRNIVVTAAYLGAAAGVVTMFDIVRATRLEYQKLGRLCLEDQFGPYHHVRESNGTHPRR